MHLEGKHCLVTGGTAGIGFSLARELCERGAKVTLCGRDPGRIDQALSALPAARGVLADVAQQSGRQHLVDSVVEQGGLDVLFNNAGVQYRDDFVEQANERIERELMVNLLGPMLLAHELLPYLQQRQGALVNVTSGLAYAPAYDAVTYCASKAGLHSFTQALRPSAAKRGVRVVEVIPPLVATELTAGRDASKMESPDVVARGIAEGLIDDRALITIGVARFVPILTRLAPAFLEKKMNAV